MNYQEMSDSQINGLVMDLISNEQQYHKPTQSSAIALIRQIEEVQLGEHVTVEEVTSLFDPCKSWADAGPILEESGITIIMDHPSMPLATNNCVGWYSNEVKPLHHANENPRRAGLVVFLMMKGGE